RVRRQLHGGHLIKTVQLRQPQRVVTIGLAFEVLELPRLAGRVRDQATHADDVAQIEHPARQQTGLDQHHGWLLLGQQLTQLGPRRVESCEAIFAAGVVENADNTLVFAQVDGQNGVVDDRIHVQPPVGLWGLDRWSFSSYPIPTACMDSFGQLDTRMKQPAPKALVAAVEAELLPLGFAFAPNKKKRNFFYNGKPHASMSVSAAFVRTVEPKRIERFHLMVNYDKEAGLRISPSIGVRFEEVEKAFHRTSGYERAQQKESTTVGIDLWRVFGRDNYQVALKDESELATATARIMAIFREKAEPYFAQFNSLAAVDSAINDQPSADCVDRDSTLLRCSTG